MPTAYLRISINVLAQVAMAHATCTVLPMRSNKVYVILCALGSGLGMFMQEVGLWPMARTLVLGPLVSIVLPVACSTGPLRMRLTRSALILTSLFVVSFVSNTVLLSLGFTDTDLTLPGIQAQDMVWIMLVTCLVSIFVIEGTAWALGAPGRDDAWRDEGLETPAIVLLLWSDVLCIVISDQLKVADSLNFVTSLLGSLYCLLSLAFSFAALSATRKAAQARRAATNRTISDRQARRVRDEVEASVHSSLDVRHLRHDLANQIDVVGELARRGQMEEADRYLADLQARAQALMEDARA